MTLPQPTTPAGQAGLAALLAEPSRALLAFDFDGTLSPIVANPDDARAHPEVPELLRRVAGGFGRVAVVTGRPARVAAEHTGLADVPGAVVLGHYGLERWSEGALHAPTAADAVAKARERLPRVLADAGAPEGTWVEDKGLAVAVHVRRTTDPAGALSLLTGPLADLARETGLALELGRMVVELRPPGADKGAALRGLVDEMGPDGPSAVGFMGDDLGDLPAFDAVDELRAAGLPGLLVCSGSAEVTAVSERADLVVDGPDGVVGLLASLATHVGV